jgi:predicted nucleotidyltransferase
MRDFPTLAERRATHMERRAVALAELDAELARYARESGGRFIRYGSSIGGRAEPRSDVDIIVDFPGEDLSAACRHAEDLCLARGLLPDVRPAIWSSQKLLARALEEGITLS